MRKNYIDDIFFEDDMSVEDNKEDEKEDEDDNIDMMIASRYPKKTETKIKKKEEKYREEDDDDEDEEEDDMVMSKYQKGNKSMEERCYDDDVVSMSSNNSYVKGNERYETIGKGIYSYKPVTKKSHIYSKTDLGLEISNRTLQFINIPISTVVTKNVKQDDNWFVYGSMECPHCRMAVNTLTQNGQNVIFLERNDAEDESIRWAESFRPDDSNTIPIVIKGESYFGGNDEVTKFFSKKF